MQPQSQGLFTFNSIQFQHAKPMTALPHTRKSFVIRNQYRKGCCRPLCLQNNQDCQEKQQQLQDFPTFKNLKVTSSHSEVQNAQQYLLLGECQTQDKQYHFQRNRTDRYKGQQIVKEARVSLLKEKITRNVDSMIRNMTHIEELGKNSESRGKRAFPIKMSPKIVYPVSDRKLPKVFKKAWVDPLLQARPQAKQGIFQEAYSLKLPQFRHISKRGFVRRLSDIVDKPEWINHN